MLSWINMLMTYKSLPQLKKKSFLYFILAYCCDMLYIVMFVVQLCHVAPTVLATDWPPAALQVYHLNICRRLFSSGRVFYTEAAKTIMALQGTSCH